MARILSSGGRLAIRAAVLAALVLLLAYGSFANSLVNVTHYSDPDRALRFSAQDPVALGAKADRLLTGLGAAVTGNQQIADLARRSLRGQALNPTGLRLLGLIAGDANGYPSGRPAMVLADRMTRRDVLAQLWLIEEAVSRDDVQGAISHYDSALRTSEETQQILFPVLSVAIEDERLWPSFIPYIREPAPWLPEFARYAIRNGPKPVSLAHLFERAGGLPEGPLYSSLDGELLKQLVAANAFADAAGFYKTLRGSSAQVVDSVALTSASVDERFAPITWELYSQPGVGSSFLRAESGAIELHAALDPAANGLVAQKLAIVPPGRYRFHAEQWLSSSAEGAEAGWELHCGNIETGPLFWSGAAPLYERHNAVDALITIPAECGAVALRLHASSGSSAQGTEAVFAPITLTRLP